MERMKRETIAICLNNVNNPGKLRDDYVALARGILVSFDNTMTLMLMMMLELMKMIMMIMIEINDEDD